MTDRAIYERWLDEGASALSPADHIVAIKMLVNNGVASNGDVYRLCDVCTDILPNGARFCTSCGSPVADAAQTGDTIRLTELPATGRTIPL